MLREIIEDIAPQSGYNLIAMLVSMYGVESVEEVFEEVKENFKARSEVFPEHNHIYIDGCCACGSWKVYG
jgi:hypothetical protein